MRSAKTPKPALQRGLLPEFEISERYWLLPASSAGRRWAEFAAKQFPQPEAVNANLPLPKLLPNLPTASDAELHLLPSPQLRRQFFTS